MKKKIFISLAVLLVLATGAYFYLRSKRLTDFEPLIKEKLQQLVKEGSNGLYAIAIGKIDIDVLQSKVVLVDIELKYDTTVYQQRSSSGTQPHDLFTIAVKSITIDGLTPIDILKKKDIRLNNLSIENPVIKIYHTGPAEKRTDSTTLYQRITKEIGSFGIEKFSLVNAEVTYVNTITHAEERFPELHISFDQLLIDESTQHDSSRFLYAKDAGITVIKYQRRTGDSLYTLALDSVFIQASRKEVTIKRFQLKPLLSKAKLREVLKHRKDRYDISFNDIKISNINWWGFVTNDVVNIEEIVMANGSAEIYCDKTIPVKSVASNDNYPQQQLFRMKIPVDIKKIRIKNLDFIYAEFNEESLKEGRIVFQNTNATITNITNIPSNIALNPTLKIDAHTSFMKAAPLDAGFTFNLARQKEGIFSVYADLGTIDGKLLNPITEPLTMVKINEATVTGYKMTMQGNNNNANAKVLLTYHDLNVAVLKKDDNGKMKKQGIMSFIANTFKLNKEHPKKGKTAVTYPGYYVRQKDKTFFSLIWKTMLEGIKKTVGL